MTLYSVYFNFTQEVIILANHNTNHIFRDDLKSLYIKKKVFIPANIQPKEMIKKIGIIILFIINNNFEVIETTNEVFLFCRFGINIIYFKFPRNNFIKCKINYLSDLIKKEELDDFHFLLNASVISLYFEEVLKNPLTLKDLLTIMFLYYNRKNHKLKLTLIDYHTEKYQFAKYIEEKDNKYVIIERNCCNLGKKVKLDNNVIFHSVLNNNQECICKKVKITDIIHNYYTTNNNIYERMILIETIHKIPNNNLYIKKYPLLRNNSINIEFAYFLKIKDVKVTVCKGKYYKLIKLVPYIENIYMNMFLAKLTY